MSQEVDDSTARHNLTFQDRKKASSYGRIRQVMAGGTVVDIEGHTIAMPQNK